MLIACLVPSFLSLQVQAIVASANTIYVDDVPRDYMQSMAWSGFQPTATVTAQPDLNAISVKQATRIIKLAADAMSVCGRC